MSSRMIRFADTPEEPEAPGITSRAVDVNGVRWAVVTYQTGVLRQEWCHEGHSGYVIEGAIEYEFTDGSTPLTLQTGDGFSLTAGSPGHRGRAIAAGPTRLFLIDREA